MPDQQAPRPKDPITCHVLDLTTGLPAASMSVELKMLPRSTNISAEKSSIPDDICLRAETNADGRIMQWDGGKEGKSVEELVKLCSSLEERTVWVLTFDTEAYFGKGKGFFPTVEVRFYVTNEKGSHVHVPLLIGPYSYTTYRGS